MAAAGEEISHGRDSLNHNDESSILWCWYSPVIQSEEPKDEGDKRRRARCIVPLQLLGSVGHCEICGLAAVDAGVADVLALDDVDDVFCDVGGVVAYAFEIFGDQD